MWAPPSTVCLTTFPRWLNSLEHQAEMDAARRSEEEREKEDRELIQKVQQ
jgi:hypothetical protein